MRFCRCLHGRTRKIREIHFEICSGETFSKRSRFLVAFRCTRRSSRAASAFICTRMFSQSASQSSGWKGLPDTCDLFLSEASIVQFQLVEHEKHTPRPSRYLLCTTDKSPRTGIHLASGNQRIVVCTVPFWDRTKPTIDNCRLGPKSKGLYLVEGPSPMKNRGIQ